MSTAAPTIEPIELADASPQNKLFFEEERLRVAIGLVRLPAAIEHIGSTAIAGIKAKPIIDMLIGMRALPLSAAIEPMTALGYTFMEGAGGEGRLVFKKRVPRAFHAHVVLHDGEEWRRHVIFRDWLNVRPQWARDYEALKVDLAARFRDDRVAYTEGKSEFIARAIAEAAKFPALRLLK
jgi:GrpB-like predicted nucleotidyltransferase (UPF0157 family)